MSADEAHRKRKRVSFTPDEDDRLRELVSKYGETNWRRIAAKMPKRDRRQCRERWFNYLTPLVSNGPWMPEEDDLLRVKVGEFGHKWKAMQVFFPGRTDINIKNHWKQLQKVDALSPRPTATQEALDPFDLLMASVMGRRNGVHDDTPPGGDPFDFGVFW
jgi:hypothetical protein